MARPLKERVLWSCSMIGKLDGIEVAQYEHDEIIATLISVIPLGCSQMLLKR